MKLFYKLRQYAEKITYTPAKASSAVTWLMALSFIGVAFFVAVATESYRHFHYSCIFFTALWTLLYCSLVLILPRKAGKYVYAVLYLFLLIYGTAQYIYFKIFNKVFSFTVLSNLNEGAGYLDSSLSYIGPWQVVFFLLLLALGVYVFLNIEKIVTVPRHTRVALLPVALATVLLSQAVLPVTLGKKTERAVWNSFEDPRYVYDNYTDPHKCMGMVGYYQFLCTDLYNCFVKPLTGNAQEQQTEVENFFADYPPTHEDNEMTGIFEGKNAIIVMMESMDHLAITEENTPNIYNMMENGINFTNYYASIFGDGATFSNEFVINTGIYSPSNGAASYSFIDNAFPQSLPNLFGDKGYSVNSFHENYGWFYNRELMHRAFGYEKYHSFYDYGGEHDDVIIDTYLTRTPELLSDVLSQNDGDDSPFYSFIISYSAHLAYTYDGELAEYAFENYVEEGSEPADSEDMSVFMAKARITDTMLGELAAAMDEDTVLICVTDHFAYGLTEDTLLREKGEEWALRQRVPFFAYCKDPDFTPVEVDKLCSNADFLPTVANLFGLDVPDELMGHDIFDPEYEGYVIFSNYSFLTNEVYWHDEVVKVYRDSYSQEKIQEMTEYLFRRIRCNDFLLTGNYYKQ